MFHVEQTYEIYLILWLFSTSLLVSSFEITTISSVQEKTNITREAEKLKIFNKLSK